MEGFLKIELSDAARNDLDMIYDYWDKRNASTNYSRKLNSEFFKAFGFISLNPSVGRLTNFKPSFRAKLLREYWIIYSIDSDVLNIIRIWDFRRNPGLISKYL